MTDEPDESAAMFDAPDEWFARVWADLGAEVHAGLLKRGMTEEVLKAVVLRRGRKLNA